MRATFIVICALLVACGAAQKNTESSQEKESLTQDTSDVGETSADRKDSEEPEQSTAPAKDNGSASREKAISYGKKITQIFKSHFLIPTLITEDERMSLRASILIRVDENMNIVSIQFFERSGNDVFDEAVEKTFDAVRKNVGQLPMPPESLKSIVVNGGIKITMHGRDAPQK